MNNQQILEKAIQKAIDGGWIMFKSTIEAVDYKQGQIERNVILTFHASDGDVRIMYNLEAIIFNHDFAKALWGEELVYQGFTEPLGDAVIAAAYPVIKLWQSHLQQMVIADDPIKYLGANI